MSRHAGSYEYAEGRYVVGEPPAGSQLCFYCLGSGLELDGDDTCWGCYGTGIEE